MYNRNIYKRERLNFKEWIFNAAQICSASVEALTMNMVFQVMNY